MEGKGKEETKKKGGSFKMKGGRESREEEEGEEIKEEWVDASADGPGEPADVLTGCGPVRSPLRCWRTGGEG